MLQNKPNLAIADCALANEGEDLVWNGDLAETFKNINNVFSLKPNGDSSVEGIWSEAIFTLTRCVRVQLFPDTSHRNRLYLIKKGT